MSDTKIKTSNIGNLAVTHALLHTDMDLTSKTVQVATPTSNTHPATKAYVDTEVANLIDSAPGTLDTLNELAAAINDDANFNATIASSIATKLPLAGGTLTGNLTLASTASGSSASPELELRRDITGADANYIGQIKFTADNDADQNIVFAKITGKILDASDGTEDGILEITHKKAGSNNISARFRSDSLQLINGTNLTVAGTTELTGNLTVDTNTLYVDTSNNRVGIGTSSPARQLSIVDDGTNGQAMMEILDSTNNNLAGIFLGRANNTNIAGMRYFHSTNYLALRSNDVDALIINSTGNVGIGTINPSSILHVTDGGAGLEVIPQTANDRTTLLSYDRNTSTYQTLDTDSLDVHFNLSGTERMRINTDGDISLASGGRFYFGGANRATSTNAQAYIKETGLNLDIKGNDNVRLLGDGGNVILHADYTGNVGIGTTSPYRKLTLSSAFGGSAEDLLDLQSSTAGGGTAPMIRFGTWALNSNTIGRMGFIDNPDFGGDFVVETNSSSTATDATTEKFRVNKDGNVSMVGTLSFASSGLVSLGSSSKQTIALPNDGGITIGSGYTFANIYGTGGNLHLRANSYIANTGTPSEIILSTASAGGGGSPDVTVKEGYLRSRKGTIQTVLNQVTLYTQINPINTWAEAHSNFRVSITPRYSSGTKILGTFSIPINPQGASNILMAMNPWYSTDGGTTKTLLNQGGPAGSRVSGSHAWFRSSNGYDYNDMQNHIIHFGHTPDATTTLTFGFYFRSEGSNTTYFCYSGGNNGTWGWTAPAYMELREVEVA